MYSAVRGPRAGWEGRQRAVKPVLGAGYEQQIMHAKEFKALHNSEKLNQHQKLW